MTLLDASTREAARLDPGFARARIESFLPDPEQRTAVLGLLADLIVRGHRHGERRWSVSLHDRLVRFNVGSAMVVDLQKGARARLYLDRSKLAPPVLEELAAAGEDAGVFRHAALRECVGFVVPVGALAPLIDDVREAALSFVDLAATTARRTPYAAAHSPGVVAFLREELGRELPDAGHPSAPANRFTWRPIYRELAERILDYEERQDELIEILDKARAKGLKVISVVDKEDGREFPLAEIDPFTFLASFNRSGHEGRVAVLRELKEVFDLKSELPEDLDGVPTVNAVASWFVAFVRKRKKEDVPTLWSLARAAVEQGRDGVDAELFKRALAVQAVGIAKLTMGLFWLDPDAFLAVDDHTIDYVRRAGVAGNKPATWGEYRRWLDAVEERFDVSFAEISRHAWDVETVPNPKKPSIDEPSRTFAGLLEAIASNGLHFPPDVVAAYLLALQTKRFVILTGISGTGKTRLAQEVARFFQPRLAHPVGPEPDDEYVQRVTPAVLRYRRFALKAAFQNAEPEVVSRARETREIRVKTPVGEQLCTVSFHPQTWRPFVLLKGGAREWFVSSFDVGDRYRLSVADGALGIAPLSGHEPVGPTRRTYEVVAVRPDWTDNRGLLGFRNPITGDYHATPFLRLLLRAAEDEERARREGKPPPPYFAVLDEMNLARVEHYFSDFLSCLESGENLHLHDDPALEEGGEDELAVPMELAVPDNVFFTGTVNVDETTYLFSPKVLDRAFTLEFNDVDLERMGVGAARASAGGLYLRGFPGELVLESKPGTADWTRLAELGQDGIRPLLLELHALLENDNRHFGYRVATEIARFVGLAAEQASNDPAVLAAAVDVAVHAKVLPKLHGTQQELESVLRDLFKLCVGGAGPHGFDEWKQANGNLVTEGGTVPVLPRTARKLWRMSRRLRAQGFASFIE